MKIERIDVFVTELPVRVQRVFSSGSWDTGPKGQILGKPVLVRIQAEGVVGYGQIRPISPGHFVADTTHSVVAAITEIYGPAMIGRHLHEIENIHELFNLRLAGNPAARAALDIALHDALGKALGLPVHALIGGCCQPRIPLEWSVSLADEVDTIVAEARRAVEEFGVRVLCLKAADRRGLRRDLVDWVDLRRIENAEGARHLAHREAACGESDGVLARNCWGPWQLHFLLAGLSARMCGFTADDRCNDRFAPRDPHRRLVDQPDRRVAAHAGIDLLDRRNPETFAQQAYGIAVTPADQTNQADQRHLVQHRTVRVGLACSQSPLHQRKRLERLNRLCRPVDPFANRHNDRYCSRIRHNHLPICSVRGSILNPAAISNGVRQQDS